MKISQKLFLGFVAIALLIVFIGFLSINASQKALQKSIGENSAILAQEVLDKIDRSIYYRIERWKAYAMSNPRLKETVLSSNREFEKLDNIQAYINQKDKEWVSAPKGELTPFMQEIIVSNKLSERLRKRATFYKKRYGYNVFPEMYVANKYGVVIASTGRTSDYWQADEEWYQKAIAEKEFWVGEVEYDESSDVYAMDIVIKLYEGTEFVGIFKVILNLGDIINMKKGVEAETKKLSTEFKLVTKDGKILYSTDEFNFFENIPDKLLSCLKPDELTSHHEHMQYLVMEGDKPGEGEKLFTYAHSKGFKDYKGLGWILITEHKTKEVFAPIIKFKSNLLVSSLAVTILALLIGFFISRTLTKPLIRIRDITTEVGEGNLDARIDVKSDDEIGELAEAFDRMTERLKVTTVSHDDLAKEVIERKQTEKALRENEEKFRAFWETATDSMNITDKDGFFTDVNEATVKLLGYSKEQLIGMHVSQVLKNKASFEPKMEELIRTGKISLEVSWITKNGEEVYGEVKVVAIYDEDGKYAGARGIFRDLTERKQAEEEQKRYTAELELTRAEIEKQNRLKTGQTELNNRMQGEQDIETLSKNTISYLAKYLNAQDGAFYISNDKENVLRLFGSYAYQKPKNFSKEFKFGEGLVGKAALEKESITLNNCSDDYIKINSGLGDAVPRNIIVFPCLHNDIVKGVVELGSFREFSDLDLAFLDQVSDGIAIAVNSAQSRNQMAALLEQTQNQAEELQAQQEELRQANEELEDQTQLLEKQKEDIRKKNVELQKAQKLIEEKARDLELNSKYKSEFLANMSHELRTPLNGILLLSKILSDNKDANLTKKQVELADIIHSSGSDLLALIDEILDLSKVEAGKMEINLSELDLGHFKNRMERYFGRIAEEKGVYFRIQVEEGLPVHIRTDPKRLEQIVKNILSNAFKFTFQGGVTLNICRPNEQVDLSKSGLRPEKAIAFSVSDTGIGIPKEKQKLIFEAFQQIDGTTSRKYGGTGLGLSISRELVNLLGGEIQLESEEGKGSSFTLYLPETAAEGQQLKKAAEPAYVQAVEPAAGSVNLESIEDDRKNILKGKKILLVDDDMRNVFALTNILEEKGVQILAGKNGKQGLERLNENPDVDLVLMDIMMPEMNGYQAVREIRKQERFRKLPIIALTAKAMKEDRTKCVKAGANDYLAKPFDTEKLLSMLRVWLY